MVTRVLDRWGVWLAAAVAFCLALPGLAFPFLSDDWVQIESVESAVPLRTPFEDFRPIYMMSLWLDRALWGLSPAGFHLTNALLIAVCAALVVQVCRRYTGERALAGAAGLLFALHPYHVENAAWIGARGDPLAAVPFLAALLAYDRWRSRRTGIPWLALGLFVVALLAKETAVSLAPCLMAIGWIDRSRWPDSREWGRGYAPLLGVALLHFAIVRPYFLGGAGRTLAEGFGFGWMKNALGLSVAGFLPLDASILAFRPWIWGCVALVFGVAVLIAAWRGSGVGRVAFGATFVFILVLAPYMVGFQERYLFLPAAASALALASLVRSARRFAAAAISVLLAVAWLACGAVQWLDWRQAARASERLVEQLSLASRDLPWRRSWSPTCRFACGAARWGAISVRRWRSRASERSAFSGRPGFPIPLRARRRSRGRCPGRAGRRKAPCMFACRSRGRRSPGTSARKRGPRAGRGRPGPERSSGSRTVPCECGSTWLRGAGGRYTPGRAGS